MVENMDISGILQLRLFNREVMDSIWEWMDDQRIIVLVGARQVGKNQPTPGASLGLRRDLYPLPLNQRADKQRRQTQLRILLRP